MNTDDGIQMRRVYDAPESADGDRILVDRLWPRGLTKEDAQLDEWLKTVAPTSALRRWYGHSVQKYEDFVDRYRRELADEAHTEALDRLRERVASGPVTLLTATKDVEHSHVPILVATLRER